MGRMALGLLLLWLAMSGGMAHEPHQCPLDLPDEPALSSHLEQADIVAGRVSFDALVQRGRELFVAKFNRCDGQGRPATTGTGEKRAPDEPHFIRTSAPDANSCAGCHIDPRPGGAGEFVVNVFVLAQARDPVVESVSGRFSNSRNTLGMFGSGAIDMLAREMTADLQRQAAERGDGTWVLSSKGVDFGVTITDGEVVSSQGVDTDLIIKPFHQSGVRRSLRAFTVGAFNHHHGMQAEEHFELNPAKPAAGDHDEDGVTRELTVGDITAVTVFQASLGVPGRLMPAAPQAAARVARGERLFADIGCATCHVPAMRLESRHFVEPYALNPPGTLSDTAQAIAFDLTREGEGPHLERAPRGGAIVRAYTDLKRHDLCDPPEAPDAIRVFCNETLAQDRPDQEGRPGAEFFLTRKLWDVGNSAPYGHRGDLTTISEAVLAHGGEARGPRDAFAVLAVEDRRAIVGFLRSLQVLPAGSPRVVTREGP